MQATHFVSSNFCGPSDAHPPETRPQYGRRKTQSHTDVANPRPSFHASLCDSSMRDTVDSVTTPAATIPHTAPNALHTSYPSLQDITALLRKMPPRKALGHDGIPVDLYNAFPTMLSAHLHPLITQVIAAGAEPYQLRGTVIALVPKKSNTPDPTGNRPVHLTNTNAKLYHKHLLTVWRLKF